MRKKYVGCIEMLFCLTVTTTFGVWIGKFMGLMDEVLSIHQPSSQKIVEKITEKYLQSLSPRDLDLYPMPPEFISGCSLVKDYRPANCQNTDDKVQRNSYMSIFTALLQVIIY